MPPTSLSCLWKDCPSTTHFDDDEALYNHLLDTHKDAAKTVFGRFICEWKNCIASPARSAETIMHHLISESTIDTNHSMLTTRDCRDMAISAPSPHKLSPLRLYHIRMREVVQLRQRTRRAPAELSRTVNRPTPIRIAHPQH